MILVPLFTTEDNMIYVEFIKDIKNIFPKGYRMFIPRNVYEYFKQHELVNEVDIDDRNKRI